MNSEIEKYNMYIIRQGWNEFENVWGLCVEHTKQMQETFSELKIVKGCVWSNNNIDNFGLKPKKYEHCWLETEDGLIIDPTRTQYHLIEPIEYQHFEEDDLPTGKCSNCGDFCFDGESMCSINCELDFIDYVSSEYNQGKIPRNN